MSTNGDRQNQFPDNSWLSLEIYVKNNHPELLQGLDQWLQLNLISEAQVKKICRQNLSCALPETKILSDIPHVEPSAPQTVTKPLISAVATQSKTNIIGQLWQAFLDELSIRWLLFLGIFLVIVSSGVLAATQWHNFAQFGQYLVLLVYTWLFWGFGFWSSQQNNLKLTSQTLKAIATLLIPINFWAISQFNLGNNILEWLLIAIAFSSLTSTIYLQFRPKNHNQYFLPFFLILSSFHLVWQFNILSTIAIYLGIIGISFVHYFGLLNQQQYPINKLIFLLASWLLLLLRELLGNNILIANYLLAIALFGWLLSTIYLTVARKNRITLSNELSELIAVTNDFLNNIFSVISLIILTGTWLLSVVAGLLNSPLYFWQTVGISALVIHLFSQKLTLYWRKRDLTAIFLIGLQTLYISQELIPVNLRTSALNLAVKISQTQYFPESVLGVTLFPYLILFVLVATWLYRRQKLQLATYAEFLTLLLGIALTSLSLVNPLWRSLNLLFSTATLAYVVSIRQPLRINLVYLTHLLGLVTMINAIAVIFPNLSQAVWSSIFTALTIAEWSIYLQQAKQPRIKSRSNCLTLLKQSCWYFGLLLGTISYTGFLAQIVAASTPSAFRWGLVWLIIPGMLTMVARYTRKIQQRRLATWLSCAGLITAQLLVFGQPETRFISLALAIGLMLVNAFQLRRTLVTVIHLGFGLSLIPSVLHGYIANWNWLVVSAVVIFGLYQLRGYLQQHLESPQFSYISQRIGYGILGVGTEPKNWKLIAKYSNAADYWAIALIVTTIALLSLIYLNFTEFQVYPQYLLGTILITTAIIWRYRQQPNNLVLAAVVWLSELLIAGLIISTGGNNLTLAFANIILGLISLRLGRWLRAILPAWSNLNLAYIPLVYGILGMLWRLSSFNAYTGLLTLGAAIILIRFNQNEPNLTPKVKYIALTGISLGIYELVIYQMQLASGGNAADGLTILALVAAAIAFCYRLAAWWYRQHDQTNILALNLSLIILVAHIHWAISSILKIVAASIAIESATPRLTIISIATSFCLGAYALIQGKDSETEVTTTSNIANDWWVYVGLVEIAATVVYTRLIINQLSLFDPWRVILTCVVALAIYQIPWQNFGWRATPWRHTALIIPALMTLVTAEAISDLSLLATTVFYLRIAYSQKNLRWSYVSLGFINWGIIRLIWQYSTASIWLAAVISLSILYIAQFDPALKSQRQPRHYVRLIGCSVICIAALYYQDIGIIPSLISLGLIFSGLGFKIRAFLFTGTITLTLTIVYQLIILVLTHSFLKWMIGLLAGICSIAIAAGFEKQREHLTNHLQNQTRNLQNWQ
ncbi:MAG TPA: hypothetical protein ACFCUY_10120 [Xenococcaceae cyanobacterium]